VVHGSWIDARAFCHWSGGRLPSGTEWEYAARGGLEGRRLPWGDELRPDGEHRMNVFHGRFPEVDTGEDGLVGTAPVDAFAPNGYGLHNATGNVWEWTADRFGHGRPVQRVTRGGSYLCHDSYCWRYRCAARPGTRPTVVPATSASGWPPAAPPDVRESRRGGFTLIRVVDPAAGSPA
jgi:formylglycine-generating enzyme